MESRLAVELDVYADHSQFSLVDPEAEPAFDLWDGPGLERRLGVTDGILTVGTVGHTFLPVAFELWENDPPSDLEAWDHVVEASLETRSGRLALASGGEAVWEAPAPAVGPGAFRVRVSAGGLDRADEPSGGDRYRLQLWPARVSEPVVLRWWPAWDPAGTAASPTTSGGRVLLGAEAHEARVRMSWLATRGVAHLFRDGEGTLWEHSNLPDAGGTPQLEQLWEPEAEARYGSADCWSTGASELPSLADMLRNVSDTLRHRRGWRPEPDPTEPVLEDGRRVYVGNTAASRLLGMTWVAATGGDNLHVDEDGSYWELPQRSSRREPQRLVGLSREEAEAKYGELG